MARDIKIAFTEFLDGDFILVEGDLEREEGLGTAVLISLFSDRRADPNDDYDGEDKKGWWGDNLSPVDGDQIGSKLWQLRRLAITEGIENTVQAYVFEALEWMIEDGIAEKIDVDTFIFGDVDNRRLGFTVEIRKTDGKIEAFKFNDLWSKTSAA